MKEETRRSEIKAQIKACDPFVAKTLADYYEGLLSKDENILNPRELEVKESIEKFCEDSTEVEQREFSGVIEAVNKILNKGKNDEWSKHESSFLQSLEDIVFVGLNGTKVDELDQIDRFVEAILKLDYPTKLPVFKLDENKRNIYNYFSLSLESISEKVKESTLSTKAVNNLLQYMPDSHIIVTDHEWNIRFVGNGGESFFEKDHTLMIDDNLSEYISGFSDVTEALASEFSVQNHIIECKRNMHSDELHNARLTIIPSKSSEYDNGEQDEIEEFVFKLDILKLETFLEEDGKAKILDDVISGLSQLHTDEGIASDEWSVINNCLEKLVKVKSKNENVLKDESANYTSGVLSPKEIININGLVNQIANDLREYSGFREVTLVLQNKKFSPFYGFYDMVYSTIRHLITVAVKFRKVHTDHSEIEVVLRDGYKGVIITVTDNGIGIPPKWQDKIFDADFTINEKIAGDKSENGLYHVKKTVVRMGGTIRLISQPNQGSIFTITLPE